ncbi:hydroxymethylglutaryl-CoA lyase [Vibrio paucivorans]|uniref:hydroxymethylglutaryl-CoA lyase n=1 Tax=Vibrio paucivorans TaxID=2829489 RepID=A0A9X3CH32_9VIBR|nr:hydroxymethylglutaryl-CoA lyase [Vibrio paucivorans]MCW8335294.1 hydroxymethylglutaryl-CoA lyase [Vibrio paucivorans]
MSNSTSLPQSVTIKEMGPRDGLQNEVQISTEDKVLLVDQLSQTGLSYIEVGSFVSPKWVPQMADSKQVFERIQRQSGICYSALTPNLQGLEAAIEAKANEVAIFTSASETFCQRNINCSIEESIKRFVPVVDKAKQLGIPVRAYLSCIVDCPYDGSTDPQQVRSVAKQLQDLGCYEISLGDTIGAGTPLRVARMLEAVMKDVDSGKLAVHFHDTYGQALANIYQALHMGIATIDSSIGGLGGCPYAKGASGNVATEEVLYLCKGLGIETGVDLKKVIEISWIINQVLGRKPTSKVALAYGQK